MKTSSNFLDVRFPIGSDPGPEIRRSFSGLMKSLILELAKDLEEGGTQHVSYFLRERLSKKERKQLVLLLQESLRERDLNVSLENQKLDQYSETILLPPLIDFYLHGKKLRLTEERFTPRFGTSE